MRLDQQTADEFYMKECVCVCVCVCATGCVSLTVLVYIGVKFYGIVIIK